MTSRGVRCTDEKPMRQLDVRCSTIKWKVRVRGRNEVVGVGREGYMWEFIFIKDLCVFLYKLWIGCLKENP